MKLLHRFRIWLYLFIPLSLYYLHKGGILIKVWSAVKLALAAVIPVWLIDAVTGWGFDNRDYIAGALVCIAVDHLLGSIYHGFWLKDFTLKKNLIGLLTKLGICALAALIFEILNHTVRESTFVYEYLKMTTRLMVILYPAGSAFMNMSELTNGVFPPIGWINKMKRFNDSLNTNEFKNDNSDGLNNT
ncbi:hypothetical protein [Flavobacterium coralii]|uniref:hypothetical protein n=1 Tax=Flavobacterium coralii TaxID=2838017 RepID=UPI000C685A22|nr:hypothetical protein [Flavobacterium sp.]|tara:strand:- start:3157 stop:3720 length:564 start_codon:yes stop_codon:yes gene_type:complete